MSEDLLQSDMPWSAEAEESLLGCLLAGGAEVIVELRGRLRAEWFYHPANRLFYEQLLAMVDAQVPVDLATVVQWLLDKQLLEKAGGAARPSELLNAQVTSSHTEFYRKMLQDRFLLRRLVIESRGIIDRVKTCSAADDVGQVASEAEARMFDVVSEAQNRGIHSRSALPAAEAVMRWMDHVEETFRSRGRIRGITTGLHDLDRTLHGLNDEEGEILTIAGRPGMGKTALGATVVDHLWEVPGVVFSCEMSLNQLLDRVMIGSTRIDTSKANTGMFSREEMSALGRRAMEWTKRSRVHFNDCSALTTADLRAEVQVLKRKHAIRWVMVDHLHLVKPVGEQGLRDERLRLVEVMETLQFIKKEFRVAIFLLVQMSRESDRKLGQQPVLADLQGSAAIEQFSDHVVFIHRPVVYKPWHRLGEDAKEDWISGNADKRRRNPECWSNGAKYAPEPNAAAREDYEQHALLVVRKNRRGPSPDLPVRFEPEYTRFSSRTPKLFSNNKADHQVVVKPEDDEEDPFA